MFRKFADENVVVCNKVLVVLSAKELNDAVQVINGQSHPESAFSISSVYLAPKVFNVLEVSLTCFRETLVYG